MEHNNTKKLGIASQFGHIVVSTTQLPTPAQALTSRD